MGMRPAFGIDRRPVNRPNFRTQAKRGTSASRSTFEKRMQYADNWEELSLACKRRDSFRCKGHILLGGKPCGAYFPPPFHGSLHAHHVIPKSKNGQDVLKNLLTVCHSCHSRLHTHMQTKRLKR